MKPLLVSTFDTYGGAARAAYRLHNGLRESGVDSRMLVQDKHSDDWTVTGPSNKWDYVQGKIRSNGEHLPLIPYKTKRKGLFSTAFLPDKFQSSIQRINPDVIHLHWISYGFVRIETLSRIRKPIIWTLHDMWPFTGGCHYSEGCQRYEENCGKCPQLCSEKQNDLSHWIFMRKATNWHDLPLTIVSPSNWLANCVRRSSLFKGSSIKVIPNGLDLDRFSPRDKIVCRDILSLPQDKKIILTGSVDYCSDERKGFDLLISALRHLKGFVEDVELVILGAIKPETVPEFSMPVHYLGVLSDEISLSLAYGAADVFVAPSREENLSNMVMEAVACGLPCVAFDIGGMPDMIRHGINGFLSLPYDTSSLAAGIAEILENASLRSKMSCCSRLKAEQQFAIEIVAGRYGQLYEELTAANKFGG